jgi:hypothetical protein
VTRRNQSRKILNFEGRMGFLRSAKFSFDA